jgi:hypothetical protein
MQPIAVPDRMIEVTIGGTTRCNRVPA